MAVDILLEISGVDGESQIQGYEDKIDILSWSWGATNSGDMHTGGGGGSGKVDVHDLALTKYVDKASTNLLKNCCSGKHFDYALLIVRKSGGDAPVEYLKLKMEKVIVTAINSGGGQGDDRIMEDITLNFAEFEFKYTLQEADGTAGTEIPITWNIEADHE